MTEEELMKIAKVTELAEQEFWAEVGRNYPEIKTGDFPPSESVAFSHMCREAVILWLYMNGNGDEE